MMTFLSKKPDSITLYSENGRLTQWNDVTFSLSDGKIEVAARTTPLAFLRLRWNRPLPPGTRFSAAMRGSGPTVMRIGAASILPG